MNKFQFSYFLVLLFKEKQAQTPHLNDTLHFLHQYILKDPLLTHSNILHMYTFLPRSPHQHFNLFAFSDNAAASCAPLRCLGKQSDIVSQILLQCA